jgi:CPA1 family monovalent cation:H+ antiporter
VPWWRARSRSDPSRPAFLLAVAGSLVAGPVLAWLLLAVTSRVSDMPTAIILQFITTFGVWILAERVGLSGVLTMVCFAVAVSRRAPERTPARIRVPSYAVWDTVVFVVNVLAFVFIGLQMRPILAALEPGRRALYLQVAVAVLLTVIVVRVAWVMTHNGVLRWRIRRYGFHPRASDPASQRAQRPRRVLVRHARDRHPGRRARPSPPGGGRAVPVP